MAIDTRIYCLPLYFQSVSHQTASASGVRLLPYIGTMIVTAGISGTLVTALKHYVPFMVLGSLILTVACGLITSLAVDSGTEHSGEPAAYPAGRELLLAGCGAHCSCGADEDCASGTGGGGGCCGGGVQLCVVEDEYAAGCCGRNGGFVQLRDGVVDACEGRG
jgi:hypothetical protein